MLTMSTAYHNAGSDAEPLLAFLLADVVRLMRRDFRARATGLGLTPALSRLLFYVAREPGSCQAELAALLDVTPVTLGRMVDRLAKKGYVQRRPDPDDRRAFRVYVAAPGEAPLARMAEIATLTSARATQGLPQQEREQLYEALLRVRANLAGDA
jgi:MarR family transcriptional regulator for hemolysin